MSAAKAKKTTEASKPEQPEVIPPPRLREKYVKEILPALSAKFGRTNPHSLPRLQKIVVNMGVGKAITEKKYLEDALAAMTQITGQKPLTTLSRKAIANFKLRENLPIGCKVTLRGARMYEFLDRLVSVALPRVRDFRGLDPNGFDRRGNYNLGLTEQLVFPELNPDKFTTPQGMNITLVTSATNDDEARELLRAFGMPLRAA
ncbi:MAG: 50S ribosomal protein L5 [Planctomycetaceae bacterium]|nr:50S ribosomal protein L5 [Planctomycetaceae bacterium]